MGTCRYKVTLRLWHPTLRVDEITAALAMTPQTAWNAGDQRVSQQGELLEGVRASTYCSVPLSGFPSESFGYATHELLDQLADKRQFFRMVDRTGGSVEWFVGVFLHDSNCGFMIDPDVLLRLASLRIRLALDIYGPEEGSAAEPRSDLPTAPPARARQSSS